MSTNVPMKKDNSNGGSGSLATRSNYSPLMQMRREFDRIFDRFFGGFPTLWNDVEMERPWGIDIQNKDDLVTVNFEVPGFDPKEIDLKLTGNELVLKAEHKSESNEQYGQEASQSSIYRAITLPVGVMTEKAEAKYAHGMLSVSIPKSEMSKSRQIEIQA